MQRSLVIGDEFAGYRIESFIARGGMAVVYCARDIRLGRRVALKLLAPELTELDNFRQRFIRESRLAASIDHPHIIPIYRAGQVDDLLYLSMRYVNGPDLSGLLAQEGPLPLTRAVSLFSQAAEALDAAHAHGLVHRDVKPANILVASGDQDLPHLYLTDFGLTKRTASLSGLTVVGHFVGTVDYVAPEQISGEPPDARTDVYSFGCVLYEAFTGRRPFERDVEAAIIYAHLNDPPPSVVAVRPDLPREADEVIATAMAKQPADRYATCSALMTALRALNGLSPPPPAPRIQDSSPRWPGSPVSRPTREHPPPSIPPPELPKSPSGHPGNGMTPLTPPAGSSDASDRGNRVALIVIRTALIAVTVVMLYLMFSNL